jgi:iron-sulfur cluster assembly protein
MTSQQLQQIISKNMVIDDIFQKFPGKAQKLSQLMSNAGINCVGCHASTNETIEQGMLSHGLPKKEIEILVKSLNEALNEEDDLKEDIKFTEWAAEKCKSFRKRPEHMFKITLSKGNCGYSYAFKFKENQEDNELVFEDKGVRVAINKEDVDKLKGLIIDYIDGLQGAGFKINNPNVRGTCGCGHSSKF